MPKTTTNDQPTTPQPLPDKPGRAEMARGRSDDELAAVADEIYANLKHAQDNKLRARAWEMAERQLYDQRLRVSMTNAAVWEPRANRYGCKVLIGVWPDCPVPRESASATCPNENLTPFGGPRPIIYDGIVYRLDEAGIHLRKSNYWICSPVFWVKRGTGDTPDLFAVHNGDSWQTIRVPIPEGPYWNMGGKHWGDAFKALTKAGLKLNPEPARLDPEMCGPDTPGRRYGTDTLKTFRAVDRLAMFFEQHEFEIST